MVNRSENVVKSIISSFKSQDFERVIARSKEYDFSTRDLISIKNENFFLLSRWGFDTSKFERFLRALTSSKASKDIKESLTEYLKRKQASKDVEIAINNALLLRPFSRVMYRDMREIEKFTRRSGATKAILIYIEMIFANYNKVSKAASVEVLASSLSTLLWMSLKHLSVYDNSDVDLYYFHSRDCGNIVDKITRINVFKEIELYPERFGMALESGKNRSVVFRDVTEKYKMYRYGFISTAIHARIRKSECVEKVTFEKFALRYFDRTLKVGFLERRHSPDRYCMKIPIQMLRLFRRILSAKGYFDDEINYIQDLAYELSLTSKIIESSKAEVDVFGLMKIHRFFSIVFSLYYKRLFEIEREDDVLVHSLIFDFDADRFRAFLKILLRDEASLVERMIYKPGDSLLDIQYTPFIQISNRIIPLFCAGNCSDTVRNYMRKNKVRLNSDGSQTPLEDSIKTALSAHGIIAQTSIDVDGNEKDVIFKFGSTTYILECKNNLIGTSIFETRTLLDYLDKAADQLDQICKNSKPKTINDTVYFDGRIIGAIILGNRLFTGSRYRGYKVIFIKELISFIEHDECEYVHLCDNEVRKYIHKKRGDLTESCLSSFLSVECLPNAITKIERASEFDKQKLSIEDYDITDFGGQEVSNLIDQFDGLSGG